MYSYDRICVVISLARLLYHGISKRYGFIFFKIKPEPLNCYRDVALTRI